MSRGEKFISLTPTESYAKLYGTNLYRVKADAVPTQLVEAVRLGQAGESISWQDIPKDAIEALVDGVWKPLAALLKK